MKRTLLLVTTVLIVAAFAMPQAGGAAQQSAAQQAKKGKPPKEPSTVLTFHLALADGPTDTLLSDGRIRQDPTVDDFDNETLELPPDGLPDFDADLDGFGDLIGPYGGMGGPIFYVDHRITLVSGPYADPCSVFNTTDEGLARARLNAFNCSVENDDYQDDDRTFTLVFNRKDGDPDDPFVGGSCACDTFSYLIDELGEPAPMYNEEDALSRFKENDDGTCEVTPAAGPIVTDSDINKTGSQQILAWPYEVAKKGKGKKGESEPRETTTVHINFRTDRLEAGQPNGWLLWSQGEIVPFEEPVDDELARVVTADNHPFDLWLAGGGNTPQCANVHMSFKMTFTLFEVPAQ